MISPETRAAIDEAIARTPQPRGALLPALHLVQAEHGHISLELAAAVAEILGIRSGDVMEVVSFYDMFHARPQPRHHVSVCTNLPCSLRGARTLLAQLEAHCGVAAGEPTADGRLVLGREECLGACANAPVLRVDGTYHEKLDSEAARQLLDGLE
ncbi:MAG: NADH-quinone oxidoreductase subunit NuoE [Deltaproteobacteria bacterium]|nr:NADH-quinone oxidoreductase subunit NuoE [Deltaproteobacteria bacterium]MBW2360697.1 NADH-quinone oxidoreductase subunit NuoE [Deltaproteobacteria bacterium]